MPKSKQQYEEMRQKSRSSITAAALDLFVTKGYHTTSIAMIAKQAGIAIGLVYHYFPSKEMLLTDIIREHLAEIQIFAREQLGDQAGKKDIHAIIDALFTAIKRSADSWRLIITVMFQPDVAVEARRLIGELSDHQRRLYEEHYRTVGSANPEERAKALGAVIHGALLAYAMSANEEELRLVRDNVILPLLKPQ